MGIGIHFTLSGWVITPSLIFPWHMKCWNLLSKWDIPSSFVFFSIHFMQVYWQNCIGLHSSCFIIALAIAILITYQERTIVICKVLGALNQLWGVLLCRSFTEVLSHGGPWAHGPMSHGSKCSMLCQSVVEVPSKFCRSSVEMSSKCGRSASKFRQRLVKYS